MYQTHITLSVEDLPSIYGIIEEFNKSTERTIKVLTHNNLRKDFEVLNFEILTSENREYSDDCTAVHFAETFADYLKSENLSVLRVKVEKSSEVQKLCYIETHIKIKLQNHEIFQKRQLLTELAKNYNIHFSSNIKENFYNEHLMITYRDSDYDNFIKIKEEIIKELEIAEIEVQKSNIEWCCYDTNPDLDTAWTNLKERK